MHTEEQAKTKWCPEMRALQYQGSGAVNRRTDSPCIASGCMHWRWDPPEYDVMDIHRKPTPATTGYCGLSGSPR